MIRSESESKSMLLCCSILAQSLRVHAIWDGRGHMHAQHRMHE